MEDCIEINNIVNLSSVPSLEPTTCFMCNKVKPKTLLTNCCQAVLCKFCSSKEESKKCGKCGREVTKLVGNYFGNFIMDKLVFKCPQSAKGCEAVMRQDELTDHAVVCHFKDVKCSFCKQVYSLDSNDHLYECTATLECICGEKDLNLVRLSEHMKICDAGKLAEDKFGEWMSTCEKCGFLTYTGEEHTCEDQSEEVSALNSLKEVEKVLAELKYCLADKVNVLVTSSNRLLCKDLETRANALKLIKLKEIDLHKRKLQKINEKKDELESKNSEDENVLLELQTELNILDECVKLERQEDKLLENLLVFKNEMILKSAEYFKLVAG